MATVERLRDRGSLRAARQIRNLGEEYRTARLRLGLSQREVAAAAAFDRGDLSRLETGKLPDLSVGVACRVGAVLGLDVSIKAFPGGVSIRDAGQARRLREVATCVGSPLRIRFEVALPQSTDHPEQRAWDAMILGLSRRTAVEVESRLYDLQAQLRQLELKRRDDPVDGLLLIVADTRANRRVLAAFSDLMNEFPRLRKATVVANLRAGRHPGSGLVLW